MAKPPLGAVPALPPSYIADVTAATGGSELPELATSHPEEADASALRRRIAQIDAELRLPDRRALGTYGEEQLADERGVVQASLTALEHARTAAAKPGDAGAEEESSTDDELAEAVDFARQAIMDARQTLRRLPAIAREALFQYFHNGQPLTVGGSLDRFSVEDAIRAEEDGYLSWVEDVEQTVTARQAHPHIGMAVDALQRTRNLAFGGVSWESRAQAAPWAKALLREEYGIEDAEFELRPVWVQLGFISA